MEKEALTNAIRQEHMIGRKRLDLSYHNLFRGNVDKVLEMSWERKMQWLDSVWAGRDRLHLNSSFDH